MTTGYFPVPVRFASSTWSGCIAMCVRSYFERNVLDALTAPSNGLS